MSGEIYLLHFEKKFHHAQHYIGYTERLPGRLEDHRSGRGSKLMRAIKEAGIDFILVRTWKGDRNFERRLKNRKNAPKLCPICEGLKKQAEEGKQQ